MDDIIILGAAYAIVEAVQLVYIAIQNRKTARLMQQLVDGDVGGQILYRGIASLAKRLEDDPNGPEAQLICNLIGNAGRIAYRAATDGMEKRVAEAKDAIKQTIAKEIPVPKKYRWLVDLGNRFLGDPKSKGGSAPADGTSNGLLPLE